MKKIYLAIPFLLLITLLACKSLDNGGGTDWATVDFSIAGSSQNNVHYAVSGSSIQTALIIAVPESITAVSITEYLTEYIDTQLQDLSNNTVELRIPLKTSIRLAKVVFKETFTLDDIVNNQPTASYAGISAAFTVEGSEESKTIAITMDTSLYSKAITSFSFEAESNSALSADVEGTISGSVIALTVPYGTDVTALVATFATTGQSVAAEGTAQVSGTTANDFSSAVTYQVTAADSSTQDYTVTVTVAENDAKDITSFNFTTAANTALSSDVTATISGTTITTAVPYGTDVTALVATFTTTGQSVAVGGTAQVSGTTANDFSSAVTYQVTAADSSTEDYTVTVTVASQSISVGAISGYTMEHGSPVTFTVKLTSQPSANVTIPVVSDDTEEGMASPASLIFTSDNWSTDQIVTVTGVDDNIVDGDQTYTIVLSAAESADNTYNGLDPEDVPVTNIDQDFFSQAYIKASNASEQDELAMVSISGDTIVAGTGKEQSLQTTISNGSDASNDDTGTAVGAAYVFNRSDSIWSQQAYLKAPNAESNDAFGSAVAISSDTIVVGAQLESSAQTTVTSDASDDNLASGSGAAYVFVRNGTEWSSQAYLKAHNAEAGDKFGSVVAVSDDTIVVGADSESSAETDITSDNSAGSDNTATESGAAYVFFRSGTTWSQQAYLKAPNAEASDRFGGTVAISGDTIVVGSSYESSAETDITNDSGAGSDNTAPLAGAAYVFVRSGTTWSLQAYLKAPNAEANDRFGSAIAISGDTIVVGASAESSAQTTITNGSGAPIDNDAPSAGAAYVFVRNGTTWTQQAYLKASNVEAGDQFGAGLSISSDTIVVGTPIEASAQTGVTNGDGASSDNTATNSGAVYVFVRNGTTWTQKAYLKAPNADANDYYGLCAISGGTIAVGAMFESSNQTTITNGSTASSDNSLPESGAIYVFSND